MVVSHGESTPFQYYPLILKDIKGKFIGTQRGEAWKGFAEETIWEPSVKGSLEGKGQRF